MKFEIKPRQTENGIVTDIFMDGRYISNDVTAFRIAASNDKPLRLSLTFIGEIDFCADDFEEVSRIVDGTSQQCLYMPKEKQPPQKDRKGLWQRLKQRIKGVDEYAEHKNKPYNRKETKRTNSYIAHR